MFLYSDLLIDLWGRRDRERDWIFLYDGIPGPDPKATFSPDTGVKVAPDGWHFALDNTRRHPPSSPRFGPRRNRSPLERCVEIRRGWNAPGRARFIGCRSIEIFQPSTSAGESGFLSSSCFLCSSVLVANTRARRDLFVCLFCFCDGRLSRKPIATWTSDRSTIAPDYRPSSAFGIALASFEGGFHPTGYPIRTAGQVAASLFRFLLIFSPSRSCLVLFLYLLDYDSEPNSLMDLPSEREGSSEYVMRCERTDDRIGSSWTVAWFTSNYDSSSCSSSIGLLDMLIHSSRFIRFF